MPIQPRADHAEGVSVVAVQPSGSPPHYILANFLAQKVLWASWVRKNGYMKFYCLSQRIYILSWNVLCFFFDFSSCCIINWISSAETL